MSYLIDTNVISEVRKAQRCDLRVAAWWKKVRPEELYLSVLVLGEIRKGAGRRDPQKAEAITLWLERLRRQFAERILPVDAAVAEEWGRLNVPDPVPIIDGLLAATAKVHRLTLVTRNIQDIARTGAELLNPFE